MHRLLVSLNVTRPFGRNVTRRQHREQHNKSNNHPWNPTELPREQQQQTPKEKRSSLDLFQSAALGKNLLTKGKREDLRKHIKTPHQSSAGKGAAEPGAPQSPPCPQPGPSQAEAVGPAGHPKPPKDLSPTATKLK